MKLASCSRPHVAPALTLTLTLTMFGLATATGCGEVTSDDRICGSGTELIEGACRPIGTDPNDTTAPVVVIDPPAGAVLALPREIVVSADEPATFYITTDGTDPSVETTPGKIGATLVTGLADDTAVKVLAVDFNGNAADIVSVTYTVDDEAPGPVSDLDATTRTAIDVDWANPEDADFAGVLVVRMIGNPDIFVPQDGETYAVGTAVGPGQVVIFAGAGTEISDAESVPGFNLYSVYTYDTAGNYGRRVSVLAENTNIPTLNTKLRVTLSPLPVVEVTAEPALLDIEGTAVFTPPVAPNPETGEPGRPGTLRVTVTATNNFAKMLFNPKAVINSVTAPNTPTLSLVNPSGTISGKSFLYYGPEALGSLGSRSKDFLFTGVTGADNNIDMDLTFQDHPLLVTGETNSIRVGDSFPSGLHARVACAFGNNGSCNFTEAVYSKDGARIFLADGRRPAVVVLDPATMTTRSGPELTTRGFLDSISLSPDGEIIYAVLNTNTHRQLNNDTNHLNPARPAEVGDVRLIKVDSRTLEVISSLVLVDSTSGDKLSRARGHRVSLTADGRFGAMAIKNREEVVYLDLTGNADDSMMVVARVGVVVNPIDINLPDPTVRYAAIHPNGSKIYVAHRFAIDRLLEIDTTTRAVSTILLTTPGVNGRPGDLLFGPGGPGQNLLYYSRKNIPQNSAALVIFNPSDQSQRNLLVNTTGAISCYGVDFSPDGALMYVAEQQTHTIRVFGIPNLVERDNDGNPANGITAIPSGTHRAHAMIISPL